MTILIFGDSITYGASDHEGGWAARLRKMIDRKVLDEPGDYYAKCYQLGVTGDATGELLKRFEQEAKARLKERDKAVCIFAIGANDSQHVDQPDTFRTSQEAFGDNIRLLIEKARAITDRFLFVGLLPVDDRKVNPMPWAPEKSMKLEYVRKYDSIIQEVCAEERVEYVGVFDQFLKRNLVAAMEDGVHPNDEGHQCIFEAVKDKLSELGWI